RSVVMARVTACLSAAWRRTYLHRPATFLARRSDPRESDQYRDFALGAVVLLLAPLALQLIVRFALQGFWLAGLGSSMGLGALALGRVLVLIALASLIWVPIGVRVGMDARLVSLVQPVAQFMAAFPANLLFPIAVSAIVALRLDPDIWLSPLMILGTQW